MSKKLKKALAALALVAFGAVASSINFTEPSAEIHVESYKETRSGTWHATTATWTTVTFTSLNTLTNCAKITRGL